MARWFMLPMVREEELADHYMPALVDRVFAFCEMDDAAANPNQLVHMIYAHYFSDKPSTLFGLAFIKDAEMVGHFLVQIEQFYGTTNMTVLQYSLDEPAPRDVHKRIYTEIQDIARACGAKNLLGICPNPKIERIHRIFHGMKRYATIMTYDLTEGAHGQQRTDDSNARSAA